MEGRERGREGGREGGRKREELTNYSICCPIFCIYLGKLSIKIDVAFLYILKLKRTQLVILKYCADRRKDIGEHKVIWPPPGRTLKISKIQYFIKKKAKSQHINCQRIKKTLENYIHFLVTADLTFMLLVSSDQLNSLKIHSRGLIVFYTDWGFRSYLIEMVVYHCLLLPISLMLELQW